MFSLQEIQDDIFSADNDVELNFERIANEPSGRCIDAFTRAAEDMYEDVSTRALMGTLTDNVNVDRITNRR